MPTGEIALLEGLTVVYKSSIDLYFYVIGSSHENEVAGDTQGWWWGTQPGVPGQGRTPKGGGLGTPGWQAGDVEG